MTRLELRHLAGGLSNAKAAMAELEQVLNAADSHLGDGDTGSMLARVIDRLVEADPASAASLSDAFSKLARAAAGATGSSLGTLLATGLLAAAKMTKGRDAIEWSELASILSSARDAMMARGGAQLGDKTVLDAVDAVATAVAGLHDQPAVARASSHAAQAVLDHFFQKSCKIGRARLFADKSVGSHDPGMLAFVKLVDAVAR